MADEFLNRALPIFTEAGFATLQSQVVAISGLGGVGGGAFLALVRCGVTQFRLAENGEFDPPDMNRQAAAFGNTMGRQKIDVYVELAKSINPKIELSLYPDGITPENIEQFLNGADLHVGVIDVEKGARVKEMTPELLKRYNIPMFTCGAIGFGALLVAHEPGCMMPDDFWRHVENKSSGSGLLPSYLQDHFNRPVMDRAAKGLATGTLPTTAIGGMASNTLLATEVITYMLRDTGLVDRLPVFAPFFTIVDFLNQTMITEDVTST